MDAKNGNDGKGLSASEELTELPPTASRELARALAILKRTTFHWRPATVVVLLMLAAAAAIILLRKPKYRSETVILYREGIRASYLGSDAGDTARNMGAKLREMLFARPRLEKVIDEFDLYPETKAKLGYVAAVDEFRNGIDFRVRATDTFAIAYIGRSPDEVQAVTARLADALVEENTRLRIEQAKIQTEFLEAERKRSEDDLKEKERALARFLAAHPEFALDAAAAAGTGTSGASIRAAAAQARGGDPALMALERQAMRAKSLLATPGTGPVRAPGAPPPDPALAATRAQAESNLAAAKRDLADREAKFTEQHPDVVAAKRRVKEAEDALRRANDALASAPSPAGEEPPEPATVDRSKLQGEIGKIDAEIALRRKKRDAPEDPGQASDAVARVVALETEWARVSRDATEARARMNVIEAKHYRAQMEVSSELGGYAGQMLVIDPAYKPVQTQPPGKTMIVVGAFGAGVVLAALVALLRALLDDHLYEPADLPRSIQLLGAIPMDSPRRWWRRG